MQFSGTLILKALDGSNSGERTNLKVDIFYSGEKNVFIHRLPKAGSWTFNDLIKYKQKYDYWMPDSVLDKGKKFSHF